MNTREKHQVENGRGRHAVVLGGSLAGLLAARVLSDHFERVTLIERDRYTETTETRRGIPQANHVHGLLVRGRQILEELFPGVQDEMIAAGAPTAMTRFMHRYMDQVIELSTRVVAVRHVLMCAFNILVPPTALFQPKVLFRVLLNVLKSRASSSESRSTIRVQNPRSESFARRQARA